MDAQLNLAEFELNWYLAVTSIIQRAFIVRQALLW